MRYLTLVLIVFFSFSSFHTMAQSEQDDELIGEKIAISEEQIPERARQDIVEHYYNGEITEAYKFVKDGKVTGYMVTVWNKPNKWTIRYDSEGNPLNKITPQKI